MEHETMKLDDTKYSINITVFFTQCDVCFDFCCTYCPVYVLRCVITGHLSVDDGNDEQEQDREDDIGDQGSVGDMSMEDGNSDSDMDMEFETRRIPGARNDGIPNTNFAGFSPPGTGEEAARGGRSGIGGGHIQAFLNLRQQQQQQERGGGSRGGGEGESVPLPPAVLSGSSVATWQLRLHLQNTVRRLEKGLSSQVSFEAVEDEVQVRDKTNDETMNIQFNALIGEYFESCVCCNRTDGINYNLRVLVGTQYPLPNPRDSLIDSAFLTADRGGQPTVERGGLSSGRMADEQKLPAQTRAKRLRHHKFDE